MSARRRALIRFCRALGYGAVAAGVTYLLSHPADLELLPRPEITVPVVTALLLAADKYLRSR